jgi:ornithine cyclodeaminase/alanine dehydrogenase-like protein (mu-crystallin family)
VILPDPQRCTLVLSRDVIEGIVREVGLDTILDRLVTRLRHTMTTLDPHRTVTPARSGFHYHTPRPGLVEWMPVHEVGSDVTIKLVGYHPQNPAAFDLPTIVSTISAYDTATGHLRYIMDGILPTALRTAAASVVATHLLAAPDSRTLGIIGCGAQAVAHVHALARSFPLKRILVYDVDPAAAASLPSRCQGFALRARFEVVALERAVSEADILLTATSVDIGAGPLFGHLPTRPHLHVNAIGSDFPGKTELPLGLLSRSYVCPDFAPQAVVEGECQQLRPEQIGKDIATLIQNEGLAAELRQGTTVYDSTGWALQDQVTLRLFAELAEERGLGQWIEIENMQGDAKSPYGFLIPARESIPVG